MDLIHLQLPESVWKDLIRSLKNLHKTEMVATISSVVWELPVIVQYSFNSGQLCVHSKKHPSAFASLFKKLVFASVGPTNSPQNVLDPIMHRIVATDLKNGLVGIYLREKLNLWIYKL